MKFVPSIGADYSGSLGGVTASRNRYGSYFRRKASPVNPNSARQQAVRSYFATGAVGWSMLTAPQRAAWDDYAANTPFVDSLGNQKFVTGQNMYMRSVVPRALAAQAVVTTAPTVFSFGNPVSSYYPGNAGTPPNEIGYDTGAIVLETACMGGWSADGDLLFFAGPPINSSRGFYKGPYQLVSATAVTATQNSQVVAATEAQDTPFAIGQTRGVRFVVAYDDGRVSPSFDSIALVVADAP